MRILALRTSPGSSRAACATARERHFFVTLHNVALAACRPPSISSDPSRCPRYRQPMDVVDLDRRAASGLAVLIDATSSDQFAKPTPCPAWSVRDLLAHLVAGNVKYTEIGHGRDWYRGAPEVDLGDDPAGTYRQTLETMLQAWSQPDVLERETPLPVGRGPAAAALYLHVGEILVHGWDLASAIG